jgi:aminoglycoside phosphotransferase family enzyme
MDLSTLDKRRRACEAEIAVNRADAPGVYLAALPTTRKGGTLEIGVKGETVEWLTHMRRFDEHATLDRVATQDGLSDAVIDKLARTIRRSHARAPARKGAQCAHALETYIESMTIIASGTVSRIERGCASRVAISSWARLSPLMSMLF